MINTCHKIISLQTQSHQWPICWFIASPQSAFLLMHTKQNATPCQILIKRNEVRKMRTISQSFAGKQRTKRPHEWAIEKAS